MGKYRILVKGVVQYENKFLLVEKWYDDRIGNPYQWEFIDGDIEFGQIPDKEVTRIIYENTGLWAQISRILYTWTFMVGDTCNIGISYLCISESDEVILSEDLHDYKWVTKNQFANYIENEAILEDIEKVEL